MAWDGAWHIHTSNDPKTMVDEHCVFMVDDDSMIYGFGANWAPTFNYPYRCFFKHISDYTGYAWVVDREQLVAFCRDNILYFNRFDFENLPDGYYAVVWWDYS